eukprot:766636-Hanusia_phi.AAC.1
MKIELDIACLCGSAQKIYLPSTQGGKSLTHMMGHHSRLASTGSTCRVEARVGRGRGDRKAGREGGREGERTCTSLPSSTASWARHTNLLGSTQ